ncbi:MAG: cell wall hydrolase [Clostridia bacterium]|nr:cell wall hydrolase [Clostridia bacterium]
MNVKNALKGKMALRLASVLLMLAIAFALGAFSVVSSASGNSESFAVRSGVQAKNTAPTLAPVPSRSVWNYSSYPITLWGKSIGGKALMINGTLYVPMRQLAQGLGASVSYNSSSRTLTVSARGIYLTVSDGSYVTYANDRPLFSRNNSVIMSDGRMYVPISTVMKAFGLTYSRGASGVAVTGTYKPLLHASEYYRSDEVLWLSRIISAESRGEPLIGQIAVGSVVMNRVSSSYYPNTIYGVIFDRKYGVQFSPILDGSIYNTPTYNCTLAAKICLEGVRIGEGAMFFLRPETSNSLWIPSSRRFLFSIGNHDFYA